MYTLVKIVRVAYLIHSSVDAVPAGKKTPDPQKMPSIDTTKMSSVLGWLKWLPTN